MCTGYAKEIKAWVCQTEQNQREVVMQVWGEAFTQDGVQAQVATISSAKRAKETGKPFSAPQNDIQSTNG